MLISETLPLLNSYNCQPSNTNTLKLKMLYGNRIAQVRANNGEDTKVQQVEETLPLLVTVAHSKVI